MSTTKLAPMKPAHSGLNPFPGERVRLIWNGYPGVTKSLNFTWATVVKVMKMKLEVAPDAETGTRVIRNDQWRVM